MTEETSKLWAGIVVLTATIAFVGLTLVGGTVDREHSVAWCENNNGTVYNSYSIAHGGFHCELPNESVEHIRVADRINGGSA